MVENIELNAPQIDPGTAPPVPKGHVERLIGKPSFGLYPGTMDAPLIMHAPGDEGAGSRIPDLVYSLDVPATVADSAGAHVQGGVEGRSLLAFARGEGVPREYLTCRYENSLWFRDRKTWFFCEAHFDNPRLFDLESDPSCMRNIASDSGDRIDFAKRRILEDAGGNLVFFRLRSGPDP